MLALILTMMAAGLDEGQEAKIFQAVMLGGSVNAWDLDTLFQNFSSDVNEPVYTLEGNAPCYIEKAKLDFKLNVIKNAGKEIIDFAFVDNTLYSLCEDGIQRYLLVFDHHPTLVSAGSIWSQPHHNYTYIEALSFPDGHILFLLKAATKDLAYGYYDTQEKQIVNITVLIQDLEEFTENMKVSMTGNHVFIPARSQGLFIYQYNPEAHVLTRVGQLFANSDPQSRVDIRDLAVLSGDSTGEITLVVADYQRGVIVLAYNPTTLQTMTRVHLVSFVSVKCVVAPAQGRGQHKLLLITEKSGGESQYVLLNYTLNGDVWTLQHEHMLTVDGNVHYGDSSGEVVLLILGNSLVLSSFDPSFADGLKSLPLPSVVHAKLQGRWLVFARQRYLSLGRLSGPQLKCQAGPAFNTHSFSILACLAEPCHRKTLSARVDISLTVLDSKDYDKLQVSEVLVILLGVVLAVVVLAVVVLVYVYCKARKRLQEYDQLALDKVSSQRALPS